MTAGHWMQIAALTSALGLAGTAIAQNTEGTTSPEDRGSVSSSIDTPSSGAIVTPEDKALGMGQDNERTGVRNGDANHNASTSNDDTLSDEASSRYATPTSPRSMTNRDSASTGDDETEASPPRTGSDVQPGDMGSGSVRGQ